MKKKLRIGVLFGGRSAEHEVSLVSASSVIANLDRRKYDIVPIAIAPDGRWIADPDAVTLMKEQRPSARMPEYVITPDPRMRSLVALTPGVRPSAIPVDVIFPLLHGTYGEDGTVQGLLDLSGIPYVGAGVLGSSAGMDKIVTKQLCEHAGIPVAPWRWYLSAWVARHRRSIMLEIERSLGYPCFVKPANLGSSVGISKAHNRSELQRAMSLASKYDRRILVEQSIEQSREIEVSVMGNDEPWASVPGEIVSSNEFYDYDAKYVDGKSEAIIPARLPAHVVRRLREHAVGAFRAIDCAGMARVDFLVRRRSGRVILNEINTIPGFTSISMFPKLWEASGVPYRELLDRLIKLAIERHRHRQSLKTVYVPTKRWYRR